MVCQFLETVTIIRAIKSEMILLFKEYQINLDIKCYLKI